MCALKTQFINLVNHENGFNPTSIGVKYSLILAGGVGFLHHVLTSLLVN